MPSSSSSRARPPTTTSTSSSFCGGLGSACGQEQQEVDTMNPHVPDCNVWGRAGLACTYVCVHMCAFLQLHCVTWTAHLYPSGQKPLLPAITSTSPVSPHLLWGDPQVSWAAGITTPGSLAAGHMGWLHHHAAQAPAQAHETLLSVAPMQGPTTARDQVMGTRVSTLLDTCCTVSLSHSFVPDRP